MRSHGELATIECLSERKFSLMYTQASRVVIDAVSDSSNEASVGRARQMVPISISSIVLYHVPLSGGAVLADTRYLSSKDFCIGSIDPRPCTQGNGM
jgi:hypothetical protein